TVRNVRVAGVRVLNAAGRPGRPIVLDRVRALPGAQPGANPDCVLLSAASNVDSERVVVRNGRFEGPCRSGVRVEGPASEVEVTGNRFFNPDAAVSFAKPPTGKMVKAQITSNTVYGAKVGLLFDLNPPA